MRTNQEIFDTVWKHFITDKNPVSKTTGGVWYRLNDTVVSACGLFMPPELYKLAMEGNTIQTVIARWPKMAEAMDGDPDFFQAIQDVHDSACIHGTYIPKECLIDLAKDFKLCYPTS